ncbi:GTP cyclohydrolase II [Caldovatus aquaticus]|uniref:GTP cyclohydrolase-2 n=1 Tax=Caldovatus aquaticus TaxID=2865671 RepID=A0ABS7F3F7_9PROT|nr:GTP cyclohydrolase II [Caldovatus aquaticus]MBW8270135.1 GTP cyclohydrolase II [Caldovatus aquaticus]
MSLSSRGDAASEHRAAGGGRCGSDRPRGSAVAAPPEAEEDPGARIARRLRAVHRAVGELRRGTPVLLRAPEGPLCVVAAETAGARGLGALAAAALAPPLLLLAPARAAAALHRPVPQGGGGREPPPAPSAGEPAGVVALRLPPALLSPEALRGLADPTAEALLPPQGAPASAGSAPAGALAAPELAPGAPPLAGAALALAKLARLLPALLAAPAAEASADRLDLLAVPAAWVLDYPATAATSLARVAEAAVPLEDAPEARLVAFRAADGGVEHLAILVGRPEELAAQGEAPLVRVHSECFTGDLLGSLRCDCGPQLRGAIRRMAAEGAGVLLYLAQEGRGIGLVNKLRAYRLQDAGLDTLDANRALGYGADERDFLVAATMLRALGIARVRLMTNNPDKLAGLAACGIEVAGREALRFEANGVNDRYLATKARRFGHLLA